MSAITEIIIMIFEINLYLVLLCLLQMPMPSVSHLLSQMTLSKTFLKQCNCHPQKNCGARVKRKMWERIIYVINDACIYTHTHTFTQTQICLEIQPRTSMYFSDFALFVFAFMSMIHVNTETHPHAYKYV